MSAYNAERFVSAAIQSIRTQTFDDFEFIIIDDGSRDSTGEILSRHAAEDSRIRIISRENRGLIASLNEGITASRGEFIARMDADDVALPERFGLQLRYLRDNPDCVIVGGQIRLTDPDGAPVLAPELATDHDRIEAKLLGGFGMELTHPAVMMRKSALDQAGGYSIDAKHAEDLDLFLRLAEVGRLANLEQTIHHYRQHPASVNRVYAHEQRVNIARILADAHRRRGLPPPDMEFRHPDPPAGAELWRMWAWGALQLGETKTARKYAARLLRARPFARESWKAIYCSWRGY